jgi:hypothetical protein
MRSRVRDSHSTLAGSRAVTLGGHDCRGAAPLPRESRFDLDQPRIIGYKVLLNGKIPRLLKYEISVSATKSVL